MFNPELYLTQMGIEVWYERKTNVQMVVYPLLRNNHEEGFLFFEHKAVTQEESSKVHEFIQNLLAAISRQKVAPFYPNLDEIGPLMSKASLLIVLGKWGANPVKPLNTAKMLSFNGHPIEILLNPLSKKDLWMSLHHFLEIA